MGQLGRIKVGQVAGQAEHTYLFSKAGGATLPPLHIIFPPRLSGPNFVASLISLGFGHTTHNDLADHSVSLLKASMLLNT